MAIPVSGARGLVGYVASGDEVDIYYGNGSTGGVVLGLLAPNILVMRAPAAEGQPAILPPAPTRPEARTGCGLERSGSCSAPQATKNARSPSRAPSSWRRSTASDRRPVERSIRALVAVEGLDVFDVQRALPDDPASSSSA